MYFGVSTLLDASSSDGMKAEEEQKEVSLSASLLLLSIFLFFEMTSRITAKKMGLGYGEYGRELKGGKNPHKQGKSLGS